MSRFTSLFLIAVILRCGHNLQYQTEAFPLLHRQKNSLVRQRTSISRESLFFRLTYPDRLPHQYSYHSAFRLSLLPRDSNNGEEDNESDDSELSCPPSGTLEDARYRLGLNEVVGNGDEDNDDEDIDFCDPPSETIEDARHRIEEMMSILGEKPQHQQAYLPPRILVPPSRTIAYLKHQMKSENILNSNLSPPPLTTILRDRRVSEINILKSLSSSDKAIDELWSLWFTERGTDAATLLLRAAELSSRAFGASGNGKSTSTGSSDTLGCGDEEMQEAEDLLWDLIEEYGVHWVEPVNQLATLMYLRGRLEESKALCEVVLSVKPWHIGALSGIVMVYMSMNNVVSAREWAEKRIPPLLHESGCGGGVICSRRHSWVMRACGNAKNQLDLLDKEKREAGNIAKHEAEFRSTRIRLQKIDKVNTHTEIQHKDVGDGPCRNAANGSWQ